MRRTHRALTLAIAAALVVAACGDDDDDDAGGTATTGGGEVATTGGAATTAGPATTAGAATTSGAGDHGRRRDHRRARAGDCTLDEPLTIGYAADFSDVGGFVDVPGSEAAQVQVDLLNEAGGVGGQDVEYIVKELPGRSVRCPAGRPGAARRGRRRDHRPAVRQQGCAADRHGERTGADHLQRLHRPRRSPTRAAARS